MGTSNCYLKEEISLYLTKLQQNGRNFKTNYCRFQKCEDSKNIDHFADRTHKICRTQTEHNMSYKNFTCKLTLKIMRN